ncbi:MAG: SufS family cysteine desulfurase [Actinomycetaceae bacterium]|nr:SufS family cysteine desulfurase [Actinomycetaceae bacterium]
MRATTALTDAEVAELRSHFPLLSRRGRGGQPIAYLDSSATTQKPREVLEAIDRFYSESNGAVNRGTHVLADEATDAFEQARERVARFIGADADEVSWTKNATEAFNVVALGILEQSLTGGPLAVRRGERIVVTRAEHHANLVPWQRLARLSGAELAWLDLTEDGRIDLSTLDVITDNTRIVACTHMSNVTGAVTPVSSIIEAARARGALVVLDTCQSAAHMPIDVHALDVDVAALSSHKMCGPTGIGALYMRRSLGEQLPPALLGGSMVTDVTMTDASYQPAPAAFEAGSQPVAQAVGWAAALDVLEEIGMERVARREEKMTALMLEGIASVDGVRIIGPTDGADRAGVVAFTMEGIHPHDIGQVLDSVDCAVRVGHHCAIPLHRHFGVRSSARASAFVTTTQAEIERLVEGLERVKGFFSR